MTKRTYMDLGMAPASYGANVNLELRKAVKAKLETQGVKAPEKLDSKKLCILVAKQLGVPVPGPEEAHGLMVRYMQQGREMATPAATTWKRPPLSLSPAMQIARDRARAAQPPMASMGATVQDPWRTD